MSLGVELRGSRKAKKWPHRRCSDCPSPKERHTAPDGAAVDASRGGRECRRLQKGEGEIKESGELTPARRRKRGSGVEALPRGRNGRGNQGATWSPDSKRRGSVVKRPVAESTESTDQRETVSGESLGGGMARQAKPRRHGMERPSVPHCAGEADRKGRPRGDWQSERRSSSRLTAAS